MKSIRFAVGGFCFLLISGMPHAPVTAQRNPATRGQINYKVTAHAQMNELAMDSTSTTILLTYGGDTLREETVLPPLYRTQISLPYVLSTYIDWPSLMRYRVLTIENMPRQQEQAGHSYVRSSLILRDGSWTTIKHDQLVLGYSCQQAKVKLDNEIYTVWYTLDQPFTYSPNPELTPEKGVVLRISGPTQDFIAERIMDAPGRVVMPKATAVDETSYVELIKKANIRKITVSSRVSTVDKTKE